MFSEYSDVQKHNSLLNKNYDHCSLKIIDFIDSLIKIMANVNQ